MPTTVVLDLENEGYPTGGGWSAKFDLGAVAVSDDGTETSSKSISGDRTRIEPEFRAWLASLGNPVVTSYNQDFDKQRMATLGLSDVKWGPDIKDLAAKAVNATGKEAVLANGFKKWPSLDEAAKFFGLPPRQEHSPLGDARLAAKVMTRARKGAATMPVHECEEGGKPGYKYGDAGKCYTYPEGDDKARRAAKQKAVIQGYVIQKSQERAGKTPK
jgi:hypothetical protein